MLHKILFTFIILLGLFFRTYDLANVPKGFFGDEAAIGYNAYSILNTGRDEYGIAFPLFFESFGDYKPGLAIYSSIPFVFAFGLTELSIRLQSVFYGIITLVAIYLLTKELLSKNKALLSTAIAASMPWLIHYNRTGFELNSYLAFFTFTIYFFVKSTKNKNYLWPAFIISALTLYTYYSAKLIIPLLLFGIFFIYKDQFMKYKKTYATGILIFIIISIPVIQGFFTGEGLARFNAVSVFSAKLPISQTLLRIVNNYFFQVSPALFLVGEPTPITRHFVGELVPLLITTIPFFYIGIFYLFKTWKKTSSQILLYWLFIYPIGAAVAADAPFTGRTIIGASLSAILISIGVSTVIKHGKKILPQVLIMVTIGGMIALNFLFFFQFYYIKYPLYSSNYWGWQYGPSEIIRYFTKQESNYDEEIMIPEFNNPHIFFKFYAPTGCSKCRLGTPSESYNPNIRQLFAVTPMYLEQNPQIRFSPKKTIYYPGHIKAFIIGEITSQN